MTCTNRMITTSISQESEAARSAQAPTAAHPFRGCVGPLARYCTPTPNRLARANIPCRQDKALGEAAGSRSWGQVEIDLE